MGEDKDGKRGPLRSSIACIRCRKSKIKCNNRGPPNPCQTCLRARKHCDYPEQLPVPTKRHDPPATDQVGPERKKPKKADEPPRPDGNDHSAIAEQALAADYLTGNLWSQVFDLYRQHFATELPFLHLATLKEKMGTKFRARKTEPPSSDTNLVLLGILTLTARFHPDIVKYVANTPPLVPGGPGAVRRGGFWPAQPPTNYDPSAASEYFAQALIMALGPLNSCVSVASIERVQAFLMLGLYEWSQAKPKTGGLGAWMYVGLAIRMAQALRLGFGDREDPATIFRNRNRRPTARASVTSSQKIVEKEVRRRTMFSCLILDRMLSCGKERVSTIRSEDLRIQLPCSEVNFDLSENVNTGFLKSDADEARPRPTKSDSLLGCFIRLVDIWGEISKFSFAGGRLSEKPGNAPWHGQSRFRQLRQELDDFYSDLPEVFQLSTSNYHRHENHQGSSVYISLHMLGSVCQIMLHREYIPFIPIRCNGPVGPLDEPTFPVSEYKTPDGFWEESAEQVFRAAKDIVELIEICGDKLPMSALVVFSVWTAAFVGIYAHHFPHMDTKQHMLGSEIIEKGPGGMADKGNADAPIDVRTIGPTGLTHQTLKRMSAWLNLAVTYVRYFKEMDQYYRDVKDQYIKYEKQNRFLTNSGAAKLGVRLGGEGGGLEEWRVHNSKVVNNGSILAEEERQDGSEAHSIHSDRASSVGLENHNPVRTPRSIVSGSFTAINSGSTQTVQQELVPPPTATSQSEGRSGSDGLPADWRAFSNPNNNTGGNGNNQPYQQQQSPIRTSYDAPISPEIGHRANLSAMPQFSDIENFFNFLNFSQHRPWQWAPGGPDSLAHGGGTPEMLLDGDGCWPAVTEIVMVPQAVGPYD